LFPFSAAISGPRPPRDADQVVGRARRALPRDEDTELAPEGEDAAWSLGWLELRRIAAAACTPRELEALRLRAQGLSFAEIARTLGITPASARGRVKRGERKIDRALMLR
jgi:DNA-directed RNA polymerase specialized sigma24 family protein